MGGLDHQDEFSGSRDAVLILRLVLDRDARLRHGELVDADAVGYGRFMTLTGLTHALDRWFRAQRRDARWNGNSTLTACGCHDRYPEEVVEQPRP